jgi:hypothetical protein
MIYVHKKTDAIHIVVTRALWHWIAAEHIEGHTAERPGMDPSQPQHRLYMALSKRRSEQCAQHSMCIPGPSCDPAELKVPAMTYETSHKPGAAWF